MKTKAAVAWSANTPLTIETDWYKLFAADAQRAFPFILGHGPEAGSSNSALCRTRIACVTVKLTPAKPTRRPSGAIA